MNYHIKDVKVDLGSSFNNLTMLIQKKYKVDLRSRFNNAIKL